MSIIKITVCKDDDLSEELDKLEPIFVVWKYVEPKLFSHLSLFSFEILSDFNPNCVHNFDGSWEICFNTRIRVYLNFFDGCNSLILSLNEN